MTKKELGSSHAIIGEKIGNYRITKKLSEGGMGVLFIAEHTLMGKEVVIKALRPKYSENEEMIQRFFFEAKSAAKIKHPNIVEVFDFGYHRDGSAYLIMELLEGASLALEIHRWGQFPVSRAVEIAKQLCHALSAAHKNDIIHRDLKPDNIFLIKDVVIPGGERVKVLDFGIAKLLSDSPMEVVQTEVDALVGTPEYMAPEQCRGAGHVDHRVDIYAMGCILFEMLCGRPPFVREGKGEVMGAHMYEKPPSPREFNPRIPSALGNLISAALKKDREKRPQTMDELGELLRENSSASANAEVSHRLPSEFSNTDIGTAPTISSEKIKAITPLEAGTTLADPVSEENNQESVIPKRRKLPLTVGVAFLIIGSIIVILALINKERTEKESENTEKGEAVSKKELDAMSPPSSLRSSEINAIIATKQSSLNRCAVGTGLKDRFSIRLELNKKGQVIQVEFIKGNSELYPCVRGVLENMVFLGSESVVRTDFQVIGSAPTVKKRVVPKKNVLKKKHPRKPKKKKEKPSTEPIGSGFLD